MTTHSVEPDWITGQIIERRVVIEGRIIPRLTASSKGDAVEIVLDGRFGVVVPRENAYQVAWLLAHALAIGAGYSHLGAETLDRPFAPILKRLDGIDEPPPTLLQ